jgi:hypothetical protein
MHLRVTCWPNKVLSLDNEQLAGLRIGVQRFRLGPRPSQVQALSEHKMRLRVLVVMQDERSQDLLFASTTGGHTRHAATNQSLAISISARLAAQLVAGADAEAFVGSAAEPLSVVQDARRCWSAREPRRRLSEAR